MTTRHAWNEVSKVWVSRSRVFVFVREREGGGGGAVEFMHCCWSERTLAKRHPTEVHTQREREKETERARAPSKCA